MNQEFRITEYLLNGGKLTSLQAQSKFKCMRLAARILEIKERGIDVKRKMITVKSGKSVAQYWVDVA